MRTLPSLFLLLPILCHPVLASAPSVILDDFESESAPAWTFSHGQEFPGAKGRFERRAETAQPEGRFGRLAFDFSGGGNYVAAILRVPDTGPTTNPALNALQLRLKRPEGHEVQLRYTDPTGQTFQRPVECPAGRWVTMTVPFQDWTGHWGGADDGLVRGRPKSLALLVGRGQQETGELLLDDLRLVEHESVVARVSYTAYRFGPEENWRHFSQGDSGSSSLQGTNWTVDFSRGAQSISIAPPDRVLVGTPDRIRLRIAQTGLAKAEAVSVVLILRTHFMNFQKTLGKLSADTVQEFVTGSPPGEGWTWFSGENDGKIHGPLRLGEIRLVSNSRVGPFSLQLDPLTVEASCPAEKRCLVTAAAQTTTDRAEFVVSLRGLMEKPLPGRIRWTLRDWDANRLHSGSTAVTIPAKAEPTQFRLPLEPQLQNGRKFVEAEFEIEAAGQDIPPVQAAWVAPLPSAADAILEPQSPFGMGLYLYRYGGDARGLALMNRAAGMARDAGVKWSREEFVWGRIEPRRGQFDFSYYDSLVACARRNGITVYAIVAYWSPWTKPYTPEGINDYVDYVRALVRRYHKEITHWEIWNEPNIFFWQGPKDMYADLLAKSYAAIKEIDPKAQVLGLSTAGIDTKYIDRMLELKAPFDILTIHPYRRELNDAGFIKDLKAVSDQVKLPDGTRRPVWLTEMGWATYTPHNTIRQGFVPTSLRAQAELIVRSYLCAIVSGVEPRTFWYNFRNDGDDPVYFEHQMGIVYQDFRPKPAYAAFANLTRVLKHKQLARPLSAPPGVHAYAFAPAPGQAGETFALWSPAKDAQFELPVNSAKARLVNAMGEEQTISVRSGKITVPLRKGATVFVMELP